MPPPNSCGWKGCEAVAQKRMFSLQVVDTDRFTDMPTSAQALYFHLGVHGDDDGFVSSPKKIQRSAGCNDDDMRLLVAKGFIIPFDSGVVVITDWKINNTLKNDRYVETIYQAEKSALRTEKNGKYALGTGMEPDWNQDGTMLVPQHNLTKHNQTKPIQSADKPPSRPRFSPPGVEDVRSYCKENGYSVDPEKFVDYYTSNGWRVGKNPMKDWKSSVRNWSRKAGNNERTEKTEFSSIGTIGTVL